MLLTEKRNHIHIVFTNKTYLPPPSFLYLKYAAKNQFNKDGIRNQYSIAFMRSKFNCVPCSYCPTYLFTRTSPFLPMEEEYYAISFYKIMCKTLYYFGKLNSVWVIQHFRIITENSTFIQFSGFHKQIVKHYTIHKLTVIIPRRELRKQ